MFSMLFTARISDSIHDVFVNQFMTCTGIWRHFEGAACGTSRIRNGCDGPQSGTQGTNGERGRSYQS